MKKHNDFEDGLEKEDNKLGLFDWAIIIMLSPLAIIAGMVFAVILFGFLTLF